MKLENILEIADIIQTQKDLEQELFEDKLDELRKYQEETALRKNEMRDILFPEKLRNLIQKITVSKDIIIECDNYIMYFRCSSKDELIFDMRTNNDRHILRIRDNNTYCAIYDWWAKEGYRDRMVERMNYLKAENKMCSIVENNIEYIYNAISVATKEYERDNMTKTTNTLAELDHTTKKEKKIVVKITIEFEE